MQAVIRDQQELQTLLPGVPVPSVDFVDKQLILVALGDKPTSGYDVHITSVMYLTDRLQGRPPLTMVNYSDTEKAGPSDRQSRPIDVVSTRRLAGEVRVLVAFVYGSLAREEETAQSDVDLLVVGKATLEEVLSRLSTVEKSIRRPINPTVYSVAEFKSKLASGNHFLTAVLKGQKVFLLGDEDELRKVGGIRLAKAGADQSR